MGQNGPKFFFQRKGFSRNDIVWVPRWSGLIGSVQHFKNCTETFRLLCGRGCPQAVRILGVRRAPCREVHTGPVNFGCLQKMTHFAKGGRVENGACDPSGCVKKITTRVSLMVIIHDTRVVIYDGEFSRHPRAPCTFLGLPSFEGALYCYVWTL